MAIQRKKQEIALGDRPDLLPKFGRRKFPSVLFSLRGVGKKSSSTNKGLSKSGRNQTVVVKAWVKKMDKSLSPLRVHLRYLQRSGTGENQREPNLICEFGEVPELIKSWKGDPHHFRFVISPDRGGDLNMDSYTRNVIQGLERELNCKLEWFSVAHYNTQNPHSHVVIRGRDREGNVLFIPKETIKREFRSICEIEATKELGLNFKERTWDDAGLEREGLTPIDWRLLSLMKEKGRVSLYEIKGIEQKTAVIKRLSFLCKYGLARETHIGEWEVSDKTEIILRNLEQRHLFRETIEKEFGAVSGEIINLRDELPKTDGLIGRVRGVALLDELTGERLALIEGQDGGNYIERIKEEEELSAGEIVRIWKRSLGAADTVLCRYSEGGELNLTKLRSEAEGWKLPPGLTFEVYFSRFEQRIETLERSGLIKKLENNRYSVPLDLKDRIQENFGKKEKRVEFESLFKRPLRELVQFKGLTFLESLDGPIKQSSFGTELLLVKAERTRHLESRGLGSKKDKAVLLRELELEVGKKLFNCKIERAQEKRSYLGKVLQVVPTPIGKKIAVRSNSSIFLLTPYRRAFLPDVGAEISFHIKERDSDGVSLQMLEKVHIRKNEKNKERE